jgi:flagellar hook-length control protein FliK
MDVNSSPGAVNLLRPEGNGLDRPDVDGQMFESFLNIAETLGFSAHDADLSKRRDQSQDDSEDQEQRVLSERQNRRDDDEPVSSRAEKSREHAAARRERDALVDLMTRDRGDVEHEEPTVSEERVKTEGSDSESKQTSNDEKLDSAAERTSIERDEKTHQTEPVDSKDDFIEAPVEETESDVLGSEGVFQLNQVQGQKSVSEPKDNFGEARKATLDTKASGDDVLKQSTTAQDALKSTEAEKLLASQEAKNAADKLVMLSERQGQNAKTAQVQTQGMQQVESNLSGAAGFELSSNQSRFLDEGTTDAINRHLNQMDGEMKSDVDGPNAKKPMAQEEWNRLLQRSAMPEKSAQVKADLTGKSAKISTLVGKGGSEGMPKATITAPAASIQTAKIQRVDAPKATQATLSRHLPEGVDELSILRQISDGFKLKNGRVQRTEIRLNPAELGTVEIRMEMKGDSVRVSVSAESAAVGDLLSNGLDQLRREVLAQGLHIEHIEVNSQLAGDSGQEGQGQSEQDDSNEKDKQEALGDTLTRTHDGRLHVRA